MLALMPPLASLILLLAIYPASAGSLSGIVQDQTGTPIPNTKITLMLEGSVMDQRTTATNASGRFTFSDLRASTYELTIVHTGFKTLRFLRVRISENAQLELPASVMPVSDADSCMGTPKAGVIARLRDKAKYLFIKRPYADIQFCM
jgi:hypothetical protein